MGKYLLVLSCVLFISSCRNDGGNSTGLNSSNDSIIPVSGTWVSVKYIDTLQKTKSPSKSQDEGYFLQIPESYKKVAHPYLFHEAGPNYSIEKRAGYYCLKGVDNPKDTSAIFLINAGKNLLYGKDTFVKVPDAWEGPEALLFKGSYKLGGKAVSFDSVGNVTGLDSINFYSVEDDYISPGGDAADIIYLGKTESDRFTHTFKFTADTLFIYDIKCLEKDTDGDCLDIQNGKLKYKLVKNPAH